MRLRCVLTPFFHTRVTCTVMVERSCQKLWKIITGHSAIQDGEMILADVKANKRCLFSGLNYFKPPSSESATKLTASTGVKGKKLQFVTDISEKLSLDQLQSLQLFQIFLLEGYHGSFQDINDRLSSKLERQALLIHVEDFYYQERLYLLRCIKQLLGYWQDKNHPYRELYSQCLEALHFDGVDFIPGIWEQLENSFSLDLPPTLKTSDEQNKWLQQILLEQCELLEILLLFYKDYVLPVKFVVKRINLFQKRGFNYQPRHFYNIDTSIELVSQHISHLCSLIILESFDLEWLLHNKNNKKELKEHHIFHSPPDYKLLDECIDQDSTSPLILLAWFVFNYVITDEKDMDNHLKSFGDRALQGKVFDIILIMLQSPFLSGDRPTAGVCKSIIYSLLSILVSSFSETSLGDYKSLLKICAQLMTHPRLRLLFWEDGLDSGLGVLLTSALKRIPYEVDDVIEVLLSLSQDEYSAHNVHSLLQTDMNWYMEEFSVTLKSYYSSQKGMLMLSEDRVLFKNEYLFLGLSPLVIPIGTLGITATTDTGMDDVDNQVICWNINYSVWNLFAVWLVRLLNTIGIGIEDRSLSAMIHLAIKTIKLATAVLKFDWSAKVTLLPFTMQLFSILQKFSSLPHPPAHLVAVSIECLTVMIDREPSETWNQLVRTNFFPHITGTYDILQVSSSHFGHILNVWERAHGSYPVTLATLRLLLASLDSINDNVIATIVYIMQSVFVSSQNWRYKTQQDREEFCHLLLKLSYKILDNGVTKDEKCLQNVLHRFIVDLLLNSSGHILLINVLSIGVDNVNKLVASSVNWCQTPVATESLKICFKVIDLLLQNKSSESITALEQALSATVNVVPSFSTSVPSPQHVITCLATYVYHRDDPNIPVSAIQLLTRIASVAPMSMFSCFGKQATPLRDNFINRLTNKTEITDLKIAILNLITVSVDMQPGLFELLLSFKVTNPEASEGTVLQIGNDSCLKCILDMISPSQQTPTSLLSVGMRLLRTLWQKRHVIAITALTSTDKLFWKHLMNPLYKEVQSTYNEQKSLVYQLQMCSEIFQVIAMELYYIMPDKIDKELKTCIETFVSKDSYKKWNQVYKLNFMQQDESVMSVDLINAQYHLAESWRALLLVAANYHDSLFELCSDAKKKIILQELLTSIESVVKHLPISLQIVIELLSLYLSLLKKWTNLTIPSEALGRFTDVLSKLIQVESRLNAWQSLPLVYSCLIYVVISIRKNDGDLQRRFTQGLLPLVTDTLTHYSQYLNYNIKYYPEIYAVCLLTELTSALPEENSDWLTMLRDHSIIMILLQSCIRHIETMTHPEFVATCFEFFITSAKYEKAAEVLIINNIFQMLTVSLCVLVDKLNPNVQVGRTHGSVKLNDILPYPQWLKVWLSGIRIVITLLNTKAHYVVSNVLDFVGTHADRLLWALDIFVATYYMEGLDESNCVCQLFGHLVSYRYQWRATLLHQHNISIERLLLLFHGAITVLSRGRTKEIVKTMENQGFLSNEMTSTTTNKTKFDDDLAIKSSPAYLKIRDKLFSIATSCLVVLNGYTPPLSDLFTYSLTSPLDFSEWPPLFQLLPGLPVIDLTCPPSISTLTCALTVGCEILKKHDRPSSSSSSFSPRKSSIRSPLTPGLPRILSVAGQQKRSEILFMLEQVVMLLISQSLRYLLDDKIEILEQQALKKQLVAEMGNFCQFLHIYFHRKGAPSPHHSSSSFRGTSLSSSHQTLPDSSSGHASTHSFSDSPEQGFFKLAELFYKSKILKY